MQGVAVAQLIVRNLDDDLVRRLKERAAAHGVSAEEEHRRILKHALRPSDGFLEHLMSFPELGPEHDDIFGRQRSMPREIDL